MDGAKEESAPRRSDCANQRVSRMEGREEEIEGKREEEW